MGGNEYSLAVLLFHHKREIILDKTFSVEMDQGKKMKSVLRGKSI